MTEITIAYCSSHAPMMAAARDSADEQQRDRFFGALEIIRDDARRAGVQACVVLSNEHFTNFFLENFPQICDSSTCLHVSVVVKAGLAASAALDRERGFRDQLPDIRRDQRDAALPVRPLYKNADVDTIGATDEHDLLLVGVLMPDAEQTSAPGQNQ